MTFALFALCAGVAILILERRISALEDRLDGLEPEPDDDGEPVPAPARKAA